MFALNFSKDSIIAPVNPRGRCEVLAESSYAIPVSRIGKSLRIAATSNVNVDIAPLHGYRKGPRRNHGRQSRDLAALHVEPGAVGRALDLAVEQLDLTAST